MLRALPYILLTVMVYLGLFYLQNYQPELLRALLIQVDVFGITRVAEQEQERLAAIKRLKWPNGDPLPYEYRQVLINRTVFMDATTEMAKLALGEPKLERVLPWKEKNVMLTYYVYYLPNDKRPTILVFKEDRLINAYKGSMY